MTTCFLHLYTASHTDTVLQRIQVDCNQHANNSSLALGTRDENKQTNSLSLVSPDRSVSWRDSEFNDVDDESCPGISSQPFAVFPRLLRLEEQSVRTTNT